MIHCSSIASLSDGYTRSEREDTEADEFVSMGDNTDRRQEVSTCAPSSNSIYRSTRAARSKSSGLSWRRRGFLLRRVNFSFSSTRRLLRDDFFLHLGSRRSSALATCCRCRKGRGFSLGFARRASSGGGVLLVLFRVSKVPRVLLLLLVEEFWSSSGTPGIH